MVLDAMSDGDHSEGVPEATGLFDNFVTPDFSSVNFDYI